METSAPFLDPSELSADLLCGLAPPFELDAERLMVVLKVLHPVPLLSPRLALPPNISPNITLLGKRSSPMRATKPANNILRLRTVA